VINGRNVPIPRSRARVARSALALLLAPTIVAPGARVDARSVSTCGPANNGGTRTEVLRVDGFERNYLVHVPPHGAGTRLPLVFAFHGRGETPELLERYSRLSRLDAIVAYPRGLPGRGAGPTGKAESPIRTSMAASGTPSVSAATLRDEHIHPRSDIVRRALDANVRILFELHRARRRRRTAFSR
jgi:hypothetical protein